jgi:hypothetical protein
MPTRSSDQVNFGTNSTTEEEVGAHFENPKALKAKDSLLHVLCFDSGVIFLQ